MTQLMLQYVLIVALVLGLAYLVYLLREKNVDDVDDYYGITYTILESLLNIEATPENVKKILRIVSDTVHYVEINMKNEDNLTKENSALKLIKDSLINLNLSNQINDDNIRYLIRLACAILPSNK